MIDEKRKRQLAFELQNSRVYEKRSKITDGIVHVFQMVWISSSRQGGRTKGRTSQRFNWLIWLTLRPKQKSGGDHPWCFLVMDSGFAEKGPHPVGSRESRLYHPHGYECNAHLISSKL